MAHPQVRTLLVSLTLKQLMPREFHYERKEILRFQRISYGLRLTSGLFQDQERLQLQHFRYAVDRD